MLKLKFPPFFSRLFFWCMNFVKNLNQFRDGIEKFTLSVIYNFMFEIPINSSLRVLLRMQL